MYKLTHGLYDDQAFADFLELRPNRGWGRKYNVYKLGCQLDVRKFSSRLRVINQLNNLTEQGFTATSVNCFKACLDESWRNSDLIFKTDTNIYDVMSARSSICAHHTAVDSEDDLDLMPEAQHVLSSESCVHSMSIFSSQKWVWVSVSVSVCVSVI